MPVPNPTELHVSKKIQLNHKTAEQLNHHKTDQFTNHQYIDTRVHIAFHLGP
jgi:hypothetical protein